MTLKEDDIVFINRFCKATGIDDNIKEIGPEMSVIWDWKVPAISTPTEVCTEDLLAYIAEAPIFYDYTYDNQLSEDDMEHMLGLIRVALDWDHFDVGWDISQLPDNYMENKVGLHYLKEAEEYAPNRKAPGTGMFF